MTDGKDKLEEFFKKNLENYSPEPAADFWARLDPVIPVKPLFWSGWVMSVLKVVGVVVMTGIFVVVGMSWYAEHKKVQELSAIVTAQREQLINIGKEKYLREIDSQKQKEIKNNDELNSIEQTENTNKNIGESTVVVHSEQILSKKGSVKNGAENIDNVESLILTDERLQSDGANLIAFVKENDSYDFPDNILKVTAQNLFSKEKDRENNPDKLTGIALDILPVRQESPVLNSNPPKVFQPLKKFSIEVGASVFHMPVGQLFSDHSTFKPGRAELSAGGGMLLNFELNRAWVFQTGFNYRNVRTSNLSLRYNNFPFVVRKRYAHGLNRYLEFKSGIGINTLVTATNKLEGPVPGLKKAYIDLLAGGAYVTEINENIALIFEPNFGYSLTPVSNKKRSFNFGLYIGVRYSLL